VNGAFRAACRAWLVMLLCGAWFGPAKAAEGSAAAPAETNLLRLPTAHIERSTAALDDAAKLAALFDDNPTTNASLKAQPGVPFDIVFGFDGAEVTAEHLLVQLPQSSTTTRVEILASTLSPEAGFRSLRSDPLASGGAEQEFRFQPAAARWIMLRLTPSAAQPAIDVAEIKVLGYQGPPATAYAFKQAPATAFEVLARLKQLSPDTALSEDERSLFADAADGKLDQWSLEEAALIASGLNSAQVRAPYLAKLAAIEAAAQAAAAGGTPFDQGDKLLQWLYSSGALKQYAKDQTSLVALLDSGNYNCVSSALLYLLVGRHLGLDVRAIEVPDHAFAVLYDGTRHADVETTGALGFNPDRDAKRLSFFERLTGFHRPPEDKRELRREVSGIGLVAIVYYNHGVDDQESHRYSPALGEYFRALSLDPEDVSAVQNVLSALANWSSELIQAQHYQEAVQELAVGLALAPDDAALVNNHLAAWGRWANAEIQAGRRDAALAVLRQAAAAAPNGNFEEMETWVYIKPAEDLARHEQWQEAIGLIDPARTQFSGKQLGDLEEYEAGLYNRQAMQLIQRKRWQEAQALYAAAETRLPGVALLRQNEAFVWASWCDEAQDKGNFEDALHTIALARARFPDDEDLKSAELAQWTNWSKALIDAKDWSKGIDVCERGLKRFPDDKPLRGNELAAWFDMGKAQFDAAQWQEAVATYSRALAAFPDDKDLQNNKLAAWINWGNTESNAKQWKEAIATYSAARAVFPDDENLKHNEQAAWTSWSKTAIDAGQWQEAIDVADRGLKDFPGAQQLQDNELAAWLDWCKSLIDAGQWQNAVDLAERGLKAHPDYLLLKDDEVIVWLRWSKALSEQGNWNAAIDTTIQARNRFPQDQNLQSMEVYCWMSWIKAQSDKSDWAGALDLADRGLQRFPGRAELVNARQICQQHLHT
jgi:tetratricopeptide (TPR) repeat protein